MEKVNLALLVYGMCLSKIDTIYVIPIHFIASLFQDDEPYSIFAYISHTFKKWLLVIYLILRMSKSVNKMLLTIYIAVPSHEYTFYIKQEHVVAGLCVI